MKPLLDEHDLPLMLCCQKRQVFLHKEEKLEIDEKQKERY